MNKAAANKVCGLIVWVLESAHWAKQSISRTILETLGMELLAKITSIRAERWKGQNRMDATTTKPHQCCRTKTLSWYAWIRVFCPKKRIQLLFNPAHPPLEAC